MKKVFLAIAFLLVASSAHAAFQTWGWNFSWFPLGQNSGGSASFDYLVTGGAKYKLLSGQYYRPVGQ